ncbi:MAG TPA: c-type cytochrome biogenesis protein CcmI [Methylophilaceae bacterium]|nr:c-type cytochrome biogenesis protein CcmI [Methylophilaceae bacterium]
MWVFLVIVMVLIAVVLVMVLPTLLRPQTTTQNDANAKNREIFRQQFDEISQDKANGVLDEAQFQIAKSELERRMLDEVGIATTTTINTEPDRKLAIAITVLVPLLAFWLYVKIGQPEVLLKPVGEVPVVSDVSTLEHRAMAGDIEPLLVALKDKLAENPENGEGWALLARSYVSLGRHAEAVPAYEKAAKIITDDPQLLADYADALAVASGGKLAGAPEDLVNQALKLDPHHQKALMLSATIAYDKQNYKEAIQIWERLQSELSADSELKSYVQTALAEAYAVSGEKPSAQLTKQSVEKQSAVQKQGISGVVRVQADLAKKLASTDTLFVFARAAQGAPMPVAIVRASAKDLPFQFQLDDSHSLMPSNKLSQTGEVVVVARISKSGDAKPQAGDLQGTSTVMKPVGENVEIEINEVVK